MSVGSAKAKLDAQGGDPPTGYISKQDVKDSYDELVADTALSGATTVAGTINGRDPDDLVKGPASATDNALVRFDGTGGKTVQNSGITVDDNGFLTSDLTFYKASPVLRMAPSSGGAQVTLEGAASGQSALVVYRTGATSRWASGKTSDAESTGDAGSNFYVASYNDAGALLRTDLIITRATGKTTLGSVGASAGLELGASGPRDMAGTGSPEGVVTAPVGSTWRDTAATTGAIKWIKASGTGNTGWVVEYGDTGFRNMESVMTANATDTVSAVRLRRVGPSVSFQVVIANSVTGTAHELFASGVLPAGFRPAYDLAFAGARDAAASVPDSTLAVRSAGSAFYRVADGSYRYFSATWATTDAWPSVLP